MTARFIAQRTLTGAWLDWDLPLTDDSYTRELSGPGSVEGTIEPELLHQTADDGLPIITEWDTTIYLEDAGQIRAGGLVTHLGWDGPKLSLTATGYSTYPTGIPWDKDYYPSDYSDPVKAIKDLWAYVQGFPDGNLGVQIIGDSTWLRVTDGSNGPYRSFWYEMRDCGEEINNLLQTGPMDYLETHVWNSTKTNVDHRIELGFPRIGRRRTDLRFAEGENILIPIPEDSDATDLAQNIYGYGQGSGSAMVRDTVAVRNGRLRRCATVIDKSADKGRLHTRLTREAARRASPRMVDTIEVTDHPNARISAITPGDDIMVSTDSPWIGRRDIWVRVLAVKGSASEPHKATLTVQRADTFSYAPEKSPTGKPVLIDAGTAYDSNDPVV